jgi:hypothetical protein
MVRRERSVGIGTAFLLSVWACALGAVLARVFG